MLFRREQKKIYLRNVRFTNVSARGLLLKCFRSFSKKPNDEREDESVVHTVARREGHKHV